jgi:hypothetical protein
MFLEVDGPMTFLTSVIRLRTARKRYTSCYVYTGCMESRPMRTWGRQVSSGTPERDKVLLRSSGGTAILAGALAVQLGVAAPFTKPTGKKYTGSGFI